jgi:hypothetical protein
MNRIPLGGYDDYSIDLEGVIWLFEINKFNPATSQASRQRQNYLKQKNQQQE